MDQFVQMDIFFFITSVVTVVLGILLCVLLFYLIKTARNLHSLSEKLKGGIRESEEFITDLKERLEDNMVFRIFFPAARKRRQSAKKDASM